MKEAKTFAILLMQAGYGAIAVCCGEDILEHKTIQKYMTRKSQGKSQLNYLAQKGKSRLGSRIRLQQTAAFFDEINQALNQILQSHALDHIALACSPKLKGAWYKHTPFPPLPKDSPLWRPIPYYVSRPNFSEIKVVHKKLLAPKPEAVASLASPGIKLQSWQDWQTWAHSEAPHITLQASYEEGGLHGYPELTNLKDVPQDPKWHPEGDVWIHTTLVVKEAAAIATRESLSMQEREVLILAALCHDLGKPATTETRPEKITAHGHESLSAKLTPILLKRMECPEAIIQMVCPLVKEHIVHASMEDPTPRAINRLVKRLEPSHMRLLICLIEADASGRPPLPKGLPQKARRMFKVWLKSQGSCKNA